MVAVLGAMAMSNRDIPWPLAAMAVVACVMIPLALGHLALAFVGAASLALTWWLVRDGKES